MASSARQPQRWYFCAPVTKKDMPRRTSRTLPYLLTILVLIALSQVSDHSSAQTNQPPVAVPDTFNVHGYVVTPVGANVLTNDSDPNGDPISANYQSLIYVSGVGFFGLGANGVPFASGGAVPGTAVIGYSITDNRGGQASSTMTFNVQNAAPTAVTDFYEVVGETFTTGPLGKITSNDFDVDGDPIHTFLQSNTALPNGAGFYSITQEGGP